MPLKAQKVQSNAVDGYTETTKFQVLHQGNVEDNHNKFYCLELQHNPDTGEYRLFSHYGRLGKTNVYDVRIAPDLAAAEKEYERILKSKQKGKKDKDEHGNPIMKKYVPVETVMPTVGSENIRRKAVSTVKTNVAASIDSSSFEPEVSRIVDQVIQENIHNITSMTSLTLTANGFETPLGPVTTNHVATAKKPLDTLKGLLKGGRLDQGSREVRDANNHYFSLIPHPFGHKIQESDWILDDAKLAEEFDLLEQLETAVQMGSSLQQSTQQRMNALGTDIELLKNSKEWDRIVTKVEKSKAGNHRGSNVWKYKVKNIFTLKIPAVRKRFANNGEPMGNVKELFHGSRNCNILSILKGGLIVPPCNAGHVTGRMFGDGIYGASNSTKALNYSIGFWGGRNKFPNAFMFITNFAMGRTYESTSPVYRGAPRGYDSVHGKKGHSLYNDEFIVYSLKQHDLVYLLELTK